MTKPDKEKEVKNLDFGITGAAMIANVITNIVNVVFSKIKGNKKDETELIKFFETFKSVDLISKINKYLKVIDTWIISLISRLIPLISTLLLTATFDIIEKITVQMENLETKKSIDEFISICIDYAERNTSRVIKFLMFFISEMFDSIFKLPLICVGNILR